jgi:hypothetical protein
MLLTLPETRGRLIANLDEAASAAPPHQVAGGRS